MTTAQTAVAATITRHSTPAPTSWPMTIGAVAAPTLNPRWSRFSAPPGRRRKRSRTQPVHASIDDAGAEARRGGGDEEDGPGRRGRLEREAHPDEHRGDRQHGPSPDALGDEATAKRAARVEDGTDEEEQADAAIGLVKVGLHRTDQARDEQSGPADQDEAGPRDRGQPASCRDRLACHHVDRIEVGRRGTHERQG